MIPSSLSRDTQSHCVKPLYLCDTIIHHVTLQDSKSHHERELKEAEEQVVRSRKAVEKVVKEAGTQQLTMQTLQLEVEELGKALTAQQEQVCVCVCAEL